MRHLHIPRLAWAVTGLFTAGAVAFAATRQAPEPAAAADPGADAAAFEEHCAACHGLSEPSNWASLQPDQAERRAWLNEFLQRHYPPPEAERALVIEHIERTLAELD